MTTPLLDFQKLVEIEKNPNFRQLGKTIMRTISIMDEKNHVGLSWLWPENPSNPPMMGTYSQDEYNAQVKRFTELKCENKAEDLTWVFHFKKGNRKARTCYITSEVWTDGSDKLEDIAPIAVMLKQYHPGFHILKVRFEDLDE
jgi:hypothetical protein